MAETTEWLTLLQITGQAVPADADLETEDFNHNGGISSKAGGINGRTLDRPMQFMAGCWSDSASLSHFYVNSNNWTWDYNISSVIAPQWDTATGRIEAVFPISAFASGGSAPVGSWAFMDIALVYHNPSTNTWYDDRVPSVVRGGRRPGEVVAIGGAGRQVDSGARSPFARPSVPARSGQPRQRRLSSKDDRRRGRGKPLPLDLRPEHGPAP